MTILPQSLVGCRAAAWLGLVLLSTATSRPASAQAQFTWPEQGPRVERYVGIEECLGAVGRIRADVANAEAWIDTLPITPEITTAPLAPQVIQTSRTCAARYPVATAPLEDFAPLLNLYLLANLDADAAALVKRRLARIGPKDDRARAAVLDTVAGMYLGEPPLRVGGLEAQPARLATAEPYLDELRKLSDSWVVRLRAHKRMLDAARDAGDTARALRAAEAVLRIASNLTPAERRSEDAILAMAAGFEAAGVVSARALLDSLRHSTAAYIALQRANWAKVSGERGDALQFPIGQSAPPIEADFWFRRSGSAMPRPTKGSVGLVVFLDHTSCTGLTGRCYAGYAILHRLIKRFPDLEVTLVAPTAGYVHHLPPPTPADEADTLRSWWLDKHQLPGALAVTKLDFWRLPAPDGRRINREFANKEHYTFGRTWAVNPPELFLVDRDGTIVQTVMLLQDNRREEAGLNDLIEVLLARHVAGS